MDESCKSPSPEQVWAQYEKGVRFKQSLNLYDTVKVNEDFYVGKQWEGVRSNGLPTPVFNFIKRIVLFLVASTATDSLKLNASPLRAAGAREERAGELCDVVNAQFESVFEHNKLGKQVRELMLAAAVDGDACLYSWFDPEEETGQAAKGAIKTELLENTRVIFGDPTSSDVQSQPYLIISRREQVSRVRAEARACGGDPGAIRPGRDEADDRFDALTDGKVTTLTRFWKARPSAPPQPSRPSQPAAARLPALPQGEPGDGLANTGLASPSGGGVREADGADPPRAQDGETVWCMKTVDGAVVRPAWDTGQKLYPIAWLSWCRVPNCCHGQAAVTGLIPNQVFVNKLFAMTMLSLMTTAYPKVIYDKSRVSHWDNGVGKAIGVDAGGGSVGDVAHALAPAAVSPQVSQFIELAISLTKEFMGATDAALGQVRPDNTSAILALQKASQVPMEMTRQDLYQCLEDAARVWLDLMRAYYGVRAVELPTPEEEKRSAARLGLEMPDTCLRSFDFSVLSRTPLAIKLDVGGSAYWSEIAQMNTLDNLLSQGKIDLVEYLERVPSGYISHQQELIEAVKRRRDGGEN